MSFGWLGKIGPEVDMLGLGSLAKDDSQGVLGLSLNGVYIFLIKSVCNLFFLQMMISSFRLAFKRSAPEKVPCYPHFPHVTESILHS